MTDLLMSIGVHNPATWAAEPSNGAVFTACFERCPILQIMGNPTAIETT
jgi:hypothetical protein